MLKLENLQTFVAIVQEQSLTEAARRLSASKSGVSARLSELESFLGVQLIQRSTRQFSLTHDGNVVYEIASQILRDVERLRQQVAARRSELTGPLRIAGPTSFGKRFLGRALYEFFGNNPGIEPTVDLEDRMVDIVREGYDVAIRVGRMSDSRLVARKLAVSRRVVLLSPAYAAKHGMPDSVEALQGHEAIIYSNRRIQDEWRFLRRGKSVTGLPHARMRTNSPESILDAVAGGLGISVMPSFMAADAVERKELLVAQLDAELPSDGIYAVYPKSDHVPATVKALIAHLRASFGDPPHWDRKVFGLLPEGGL